MLQCGMLPHALQNEIADQHDPRVACCPVHLVGGELDDPGIVDDGGIAGWCI